MSNRVFPNPKQNGKNSQHCIAVLTFSYIVVVTVPDAFAELDVFAEPQVDTEEIQCKEKLAFSLTSNFEINCAIDDDHLNKLISLQYKQKVEKQEQSSQGKLETVNSVPAVTKFFKAGKSSSAKVEQNTKQAIRQISTKDFISLLKECLQSIYEVEKVMAVDSPSNELPNFMENC